MAILTLVVGVLTLTVAAAALVFAALSWRHARRAERRDTDRNDVSWQLVEDAPGRFTLLNSGRDVALNVLAVVTINDETIRADAPRLAPGESLQIQSQAMASAHQESARERRAYDVSLQGASSYLPVAAIPPLGVWVHTDTRVTWSSEAGRWEAWSDRAKYVV